LSVVFDSSKVRNLVTNGWFPRNQMGLYLSISCFLISTSVTARSRKKYSFITTPEASFDTSGVRSPASSAIAILPTEHASPNAVTVRSCRSSRRSAAAVIMAHIRKPQVLGAAATSTGIIASLTRDLVIRVPLRFVFGHRRMGQKPKKINNWNVETRKVFWNRLSSRLSEQIHLSWVRRFDV